MDFWRPPKLYSKDFEPPAGPIATIKKPRVPKHDGAKPESSIEHPGSAAATRVLVQDASEQGYFEETAAFPAGMYTPNIVYRDVLLAEARADSDGLNPASATSTIAAHMDHAENADLDGHVIFTEQNRTDDDVCTDPVSLGYALNHGDQLAYVHNGSAEEAPGHMGQMAYDGYFEQQVLSRCGLHALNNGIGHEFLTSDLMTVACSEYLAEASREGLPEHRSDHEHATGWYSEAVMAFALRMQDNVYKLDLDNPLPTSDAALHRLTNAATIAVIVNQNQGHWTAIRVVAGVIWLLDSTEDTRKTDSDQTHFLTIIWPLVSSGRAPSINQVLIFLLASPSAQDSPLPMTPGDFLAYIRHYRRAFVLQVNG